MKPIIECVPNFSEGKDLNIIKQITDAIESVEGVKLLDVDPGKATNRTVVTFVGSPEDVIEAAFRGFQKAAELIDMTKHTGEHPRMGAVDVCPLIPIANISVEETIPYAHKLGKRVAEELQVPVYMYEYAQSNPERKNLSVIRTGEYEGFGEKIKLAEWKPDYGAALFNTRSGASVIGVRDILIAYNVNLNTTSTRRANSVAFDVREQGRLVKDKEGKETRQPGTCKSVKAIGWYIDEYGIAQISMNLTNIHETPIHIAFDECCKSADRRGLRVTGSELVGLIPLKSMIDAGKYFLRKQQRSVGVSDAEIIKIAIKSMGLDELKEFDPNKKIIEYAMRDSGSRPLVDMSLTAFANETASESPAPGGGSISAYLATLGVSLGTMVANLSSHKRGWDERWEEFGNWAEKGQALKEKLLFYVDEDTRSFNAIMDCFGMPKSTDTEKKLRSEAIQKASQYATLVPLQVMETAEQCFEIIEAMIDQGNPNSITDAGVGALCVRSAIIGAYLNVKVNASSLKDEAFIADVLARANAIKARAIEKEATILVLLDKKLNV